MLHAVATSRVCPCLLVLATKTASAYAASRSLQHCIVPQVRKPNASYEGSYIKMQTAFTAPGIGLANLEGSDLRLV